FLFFHDLPRSLIYPLSLHDPLPIFTCTSEQVVKVGKAPPSPCDGGHLRLCSRPQRLSTGARILFLELTEVWLCCSTAWYILSSQDRKSTRLNSSHVSISYAVFCLKK